MELNKVYNMDCLDGMRQLPDASVHLILSDLPYGVTNHQWDSIIPLGPLWEEYSRLVTPTGAIVLTATQPFTNILINGKPKWFKYSLVWIKNNHSGFVNAKVKPMKKHEDVLVFSPAPINPDLSFGRNMTYNPQGLKPYNKVNKTRPADGFCTSFRGDTYTQEFTNYPTSILKFDKEGTYIHPTQKPLALFEYLVLTYSNPGELVMDNCMGSGTTAIAAMNTGRNYIGFELDKENFDACQNRIRNHQKISDNNLEQLFV